MALKVAKVIVPRIHHLKMQALGYGFGVLRWTDYVFLFLEQLSLDGIMKHGDTNSRKTSYRTNPILRVLEESFLVGQ
jgi:hypothetical protein